MSEADFEAFDLLVAMDAGNAEVMTRRCPPGRQGRVVRLLDFLPAGAVARGAAGGGVGGGGRGGLGGDVPDPYYGGPAGFERVLDLVEAGCDGLAAALAADHANPAAGL
jgi:protein-tyrosine phosphatase